MKKIYDFFNNYGAVLLIVLAALLVFGCLIIPFFVGIGRVMWDMAINNPTELV